jgi:similar to stage IV sporulation protein
VFASILFFSSFVWKIEIFGARAVAASDILEYLYSQGIRQTARKSQVDLNGTEVLLLKKFDALSDVACEIKGTILKISVVERSSPIVQFDKSVPVDIVAAIDATVREFTVYNGVAMAHMGKEVKAGDVLISGRVPYEYRNESGMQKVHAMGVALAYGKISLTESIELYVPSQGAPYVSQKIYYAFGRAFTVTSGDVVDESLFLEEKNKTLSLGWIELPILFDEVRWYTMDNCRPKTDTEIYGEIYDIATKRISDKQKVRAVTYQFSAIEDQKAEVAIVVDVSTNIAIEQEILD